MIATTIEQSKKLLELGLNQETSDMFWLQEPGDPEVHYLMVREQDDDFEPDWRIPAWSLSALLKLMPEIRTEHGIMQPYLVGGAGRRFRFLCFYKITYNTQNYDEPVDAAYEMIVWLLENGHIKNDTVSKG